MNQTTQSSEPFVPKDTTVLILAEHQEEEEEEHIDGWSGEETGWSFSEALRAACKLVRVTGTCRGFRKTGCVPKAQGTEGMRAVAFLCDYWSSPRPCCLFLQVAAQEIWHRWVPALPALGLGQENWEKSCEVQSTGNARLPGT